MINYIQSTIQGYEVCYVYLDNHLISSDLKFMKQLKENHQRFKIVIPEQIRSIVKSRPIFINSYMIFHTLPHKQASLRYHINLCEVFKSELKESKLDILFYSGQSLQIKDIKPSTFNRMKKIIKLLMKDERLSR